MYHKWTVPKHACDIIIVNYGNQQESFLCDNFADFQIVFKTTYYQPFKWLLPIQSTCYITYSKPYF